MRIHIIGTSGSGKSTFADKLASQLRCRHIELDSLYWSAQWTHISDAELCQRIEQPLTAQNWVIDGEYSQLNRTIWAKANLVVWLDYPLPIVLWRLVRRGIRYALTKQNLWDSGNREDLTQFLSRRSIVWKALRSHGQRHKTYRKVMADPQFAGVRFLRFCTPQATANWLHSV